MRDYTYLIPKDKFDDSHIAELSKYSISETRPIVPALLEWLQDGNWPVSGQIANYLKPYLNEIQNEVVLILKSDDEVWKYWVLLLLTDCGYKPGKTIMDEVNRIVNKPTKNELSEGVHKLAIKLCKKHNKI